jgi:hypothetical protein
MIRTYERASRANKGNRSNKGNMLVLSGIFLALLAVLVLVACSFGGLFFVFNRIQTTTDELALTGARKLNEQDRIGQMNNMIARCRQLVYDAHESHTYAYENADHLNQLAEQLHEEAREGAILLEAERQKLRTVAVNEAKSAIADRYNELKEAHALVLPWLKVAIPTTPVVDFGCAKDISSNVAELKGIDELETEDSKLYVQTDSHLYKENIDAKISSDSELHFWISSLPAPVQSTVAPARCILAKQYKALMHPDLPSVCKVEMKLGVDTGIGADAHQEMKATGIAVATGGEKVL